MKAIAAIVLFVMVLTAGLTAFAIMSPLPGWATALIILFAVCILAALAVMGALLFTGAAYAAALVFGMKRRD